MNPWNPGDGFLVLLALGFVIQMCIIEWKRHKAKKEKQRDTAEASARLAGRASMGEPDA